MECEYEVCGGGILIDAPSIKPGMIHIGINQGSFDAGRKSASMLQLQSGSKIIFHGKAAIAEGVIINNGGIIEFGENFSSNFGLFITCSKRISFGDNCLLGWNNHFIDNDGHKVIDGAGRVSHPKEIYIGNHTWITSETHFMKGSRVGDDSVVGYNAFVLKDFSGSNNCLIAGNPAHVVKENISWHK